MTALLILLTVITISILATRIATRALELTGISEEAARFQARSAFSGVGFTTDEAENVVNHPARRRIILTLMLLGNAGLATAISTFVLSFAGSGETLAVLQRGLLLIAGIAGLTYLAQSKWVDRYLSRAITRGLRRFTELEVVDLYSALDLGTDHSVSRLQVKEGSWLAGKTLQELNLAQEGLLVLCIESSEGNDYAPPGDSRVQAGDTMVLYGHKDTLVALSERVAGGAGKRAHGRAVRAHRRRQEAAEMPPEAHSPRM